MKNQQATFITHSSKLHLKVSIIINNYNYAAYLKQAINSCLSQSYHNIEVVVVDDGSIDSSRAIIEGYGNRIVPVFKENGGQASAINAGFYASSGDIIALLDADDYLFPDAVKTILSAWKPDVSQIQSRLDLVDAIGRYIDLYPAPEIKFDSGDVTSLLLSKGRYNTTITSGTSFSREALDKIIPIPEDDFRISADGYLVTVAPFYGQVASVETSIGNRRKHDSNLWAGDGKELNVERVRKSFNHDFARYKYLKLVAQETGHSLEFISGLRDYLHVQDRLISLQLSPERHSIEGDTKLGLALRGWLAVWKYSSFSWKRKIVLSSWFLTAGFLPQPLAVRAITWKLAGKARPKWVDYTLKGFRRATR